jgi:hypothetical protein
MVDDDNGNNSSHTSIDCEVESWSKMAYALRQEDRVLFSKMLSEIKQYSAAFEKMTGASTPAESLLMSIILQNQEMINSLMSRFEYLLQQEYQKKKKKESGTMGGYISDSYAL